MADENRSSQGAGEYLKRHTEALIKDLGYSKACEITGKSKATLGRYASLAPENSERFMPVQVVADLESAASVPFVTKALAEIQKMTLEYGKGRGSRSGGLNSDVILLSQRFATLMAEYNHSIGDGVISLNEAKRLLDETNSLQQVLMEMKLHLQNEELRNS